MNLEQRDVHGVRKRGSSDWDVVRAAVVQHRVLRCFRTLRHMSDGWIVDFEHLQYVCTLGEGTYGSVDKHRLQHPDGAHSLYAVKHLRNCGNVFKMEAMDTETLVHTIERVSSLVLQSQSSKAGSSFPGMSLPELPPGLGTPEEGDSAAVGCATTPNSGMLGLPLPPKLQQNTPRDLKGSLDGKDDWSGTTPPSTALEVESRASGSVTHGHSAAPQGAVDVNLIVAGMTAEERQFLAELHIMRKLSHPNIVRYLGCGVLIEKGRPGEPPQHSISIAQECCEGGSLARLVRHASVSVGRRRLYSYHDAWRWSMQTAKALQYMHESIPRIVHRDLKPENLLLTQAGRGGDVRVADFGLTKLCKPLPSETTPSEETTPSAGEKQNERYIMTGQTGSFLYMAPEVVRCEPYNEKVDIFSLGVIMYELFTTCPLVARIGRADLGPSHTDSHGKEAFAQRVADGFRLELKPSWPPALQAIIARCWHADDQMRPSARQLVCMLADIEGEIQVMDLSCTRGVVGQGTGGGAIQAAAAAPSGACCTIC